MKKIKIILSAIFLSMFFIVSCNDEESITIEAPGSVAVEAGFGEAIFTWNFPSDLNAEFVRVDYFDTDGNSKHQKFSKNITNAIVNQLEEREYEFTVTASDLNNNRSEAIVVKTTPKKPPYLLVANTITAVPDLGGITLNWENVSGKNIGINVKYTDANDLEQVFVYNSSDTNGATSISGLAATEQEFEAYVTNARGQKSSSKFFTLTPLTETELDKSNWTIFDFSSQEEVGEGPVNGWARATIDGDTNTFWHSQWQGGSPVYPHHFSVDMKTVKKVTRVVLYTRNNDNRGMTKFSVSGSLDGVSWTDLGEYDFDNENYDGQSFGLGGIYQLRYIKITALEGVSTFVFLAELNVWGK
ncbi:DUF5126 domain-containing protein [Polaribacter ponticola]|uniref:DUF5126 domain-containing protein n=1 Tax=Polaribacter ponticola TaxID=2978475 RepID=A0ABT5SB22_9FLAO|nr:DUF5126 domain-containing protein [Polaribacter sp. MSW5]MDD7915309.1 DUF5126 domain-containing protein [Polaribacter sp. MSW5]